MIFCATVYCEGHVMCVIISTNVLHYTNPHDMIISGECQAGNVEVEIGILSNASVSLWVQTAGQSWCKLHNQSAFICLQSLWWDKKILAECYRGMLIMHFECSYMWICRDGKFCLAKHLETILCAILYQINTNIKYTAKQSDVNQTQLTGYYQ